MHHESVRVAYANVVDLIPRLLPPHNPLYPRPDIVLHIGLAAGRNFYTLERGAHGRGYGAIPDVDGDRFPDDVADAKFPPELFPPVLTTSLDAGDVLGRWRANLGYAAADEDDEVKKRRERLPDVRLSPDAGNFLCGFIYYNSLAHYFSLKEDERPVAFLHVPDLSQSEEQLAVGRKVAVALIMALVESRRHVGVTDGVERVVKSDEMRGERAGTDVNFA